MTARITKVGIGNVLANQSKALQQAYAQKHNIGIQYVQVNLIPETDIPTDVSDYIVRTRIIVHDLVNKRTQNLVMNLEIQGQGQVLVSKLTPLKRRDQ